MTSLKWGRVFVKRLANESGVTLIELLAVIVILAVIAAVAVPTVLGQISKSKYNADLSSEQVIVDALQRAEFDFQATANTTNSLALDPANLASGTAPEKTPGLLLNSTAGDDAIANADGHTQNVLDLLTNGYTNGTKTTGHGFISTISKPNTGADWQISNNASTIPTGAPNTTFTYPTNIDGTTNTLYIYPGK